MTTTRIRRLRIENAYADDPDTTTNEVEVEVADQAPGQSDDDYRQYLDDLIFDYTGTGRTDDVGSYYDATSIDGLEPAIYLEWCD